MAAYFQLFEKLGDGEPVRFSEIDDKLRAAFKAPADPEKYFLRWYDLIGFRLACGQEWSEIFTAMEEIGPEYLAVAQWIEGRYSVKAWMGR